MIGLPADDLVLTLVFLLAFLVGSVPFGLLVARAFKVRDVTAHGSGNIGATNVSRVVGFWPAGFLTFALDVAKGAVPIALLAYSGLYAGMLSRFGGGTGDISLTDLWVTGLCAVLGHCFSPWVHFKGGKGVATGFGAFLVLSPVSALCGILAFAITFVNTKTGSLSSLVGLTVVAVSYLVLNPIGPHVWAGAAIVMVILIRHQANIERLLEGRESRFTGK